MRIIVEADSRKDARTLSEFIYNLLCSWGVPTTLDSEFEPRSHERTRRNVRVLADSLEHPIEVSMNVAPEPPAFRWTDFLTEDPEDGIIVKGTFVKATSVVSLVIDGHSWKEILTWHPELCENDIRACLMWVTETDGVQLNGNRQEDSGQRRQKAGQAVGRNHVNMVYRASYPKGPSKFGCEYPNCDCDAPCPKVENYLRKGAKTP